MVEMNRKLQPVGCINLLFDMRNISLRLFSSACVLGQDFVSVSKAPANNEVFVFIDSQLALFCKHSCGWKIDIVENS